MPCMFATVRTCPKVVKTKCFYRSTYGTNAKALKAAREWRQGILSQRSEVTVFMHREKRLVEVIHRKGLRQSISYEPSAEGRADAIKRARRLRDQLAGLTAEQVERGKLYKKSLPHHATRRSQQRHAAVEAWTSVGGVRSFEEAKMISARFGFGGAR